ncbi:hypothetical protein SDC9_106400 [bioreactor metagenome]|uniref:Uncharacterized protein n=1 Tax=bioreactor metagenome TaxID=1076179 RepID=A0A645B398_9ZZZZ
MKIKPARQIRGDFPPQLRHAGVGGVTGKALFQRINARVPDVPGGDKVRLAHAQGDGVLHFLQNIKKSADTGWLRLKNPLG